MSFQITQDIDKTTGVVFVKIFNEITYASIALNQGTSLQELCLGNKQLIKDLNPLQYKDTYASSILFPFANRIKNGQYTFQNKKYQLAINEVERNNAIHGFLHDKAFQIIDASVKKDKAALLLEYNQEEEVQGFPFTYKVQLLYRLSDTNLSLEVRFTNTSKQTFPFTYGWHPYFYSEDLSKSSLHFKSSQKIHFDTQMITEKVVNKETSAIVNIGSLFLDDCYVLDTNKVQFKTPAYHLELSSTTKESFLQVYTLPINNCLAIEPVSGVPDSFNNKLGLQELTPNETYITKWDLALISSQ